MSTKPLRFKDVEPGASIPTAKKGPITNELMVRWAAGSGDFNPIHYDKGWALSQGLPNLVIAGPMKTAMLAQALANWAGDINSLKSLQCRYRGMDFPGDTFTFGGKVTAKEPLTNGGQITCEVWVQNQRGETNTTGVAKLVLPD